MTRFGYRKKALGQGGFGRVFPAFRIDDDGSPVAGDELAIKLLREEWCDSEEVVARFRREVQLQQEQLDHRHVMPIIARNLSAEPPYFVMPRASHDLKEMLEDGLAGQRDEALTIFEGIMDAIAHAHDRGVLHRDLKPANVLFVEGIPRVSDFGFGKRMAADATDLTETGQWFGSQRYMAPEQMSAREATAAADVYALGKILGELLTGERPEPFLFDPAKMPQEFRYFLGRCCDNDPEKRYANAGKMQEAFRVLTSATAVVDPPIEGAERLIQEWMIAEEGPDQKQVADLDSHFHRYEAEEELYSRVVPHLPPGLLDQYMTFHPQGFRRTIEIFDSHIAGPLEFSYCDVVADFYESIWGKSTDLAVKRIVAARLWALGPDHNRWHVGQVFASVATSAKDTSDAMLIADLIRQVPENGHWHEGYLHQLPLPKPIADALQGALDEEDA